MTAADVMGKRMAIAAMGTVAWKSRCQQMHVTKRPTGWTDGPLVRQPRLTLAADRRIGLERVGLTTAVMTLKSQ